MSTAATTVTAAEIASQMDFIQTVSFAFPIQHTSADNLGKKLCATYKLLSLQYNSTFAAAWVSDGLRVTLN